MAAGSAFGRIGMYKRHDDLTTTPSPIALRSVTEKESWPDGYVALMRSGKPAAQGPGAGS
jgi:hypothetical protein